MAIYMVYIRDYQIRVPSADRTAPYERVLKEDWLVAKVSG